MRIAGRRSLVLVACFAPLAGVLAQAPPRSALVAKLTPCPAAGLPTEALCGTLDVPESREAPGGRRLSLNVVVLPAASDTVATDAVFFLAGGGVVPATRYAGFISRAFPALRRSRDVVLVDQRGTWGSNPLPCAVPVTAAAAYGGDVLDAIRACRDSLSQRADLRAYTTPNAVADLEAVRSWLGYEQVSLYGVSYGTKVAQVYLRAYPGRVRAAALYGVVPVAVPMQIDLARSAQIILGLVFDRCAADNACRAAFPNVATEFDSVLARLGMTPVSVSVAAADSSTGSVTITDRAFRDAVAALLASARAIERLPFIIHAAHGGNFTPLARAIVGDGPPPPPGPPRGVFLSIICSEALALIRADQIDSASRGTFFGDAPVRSQLAQCDVWPRASMPASFWEPVRGDAPVLAISGDLDPVTPSRYGAQVVAGFRNGRHIVVSNRSHNDVDPCITSLFEQFLISGSAGTLDTSCTTEPTQLRFVTEPRAPTPRPLPEREH